MHTFTRYISLIPFLLFSWLTNSQDFKFFKECKLISAYELTKTGYSSDGSDRARDGKPRFSGPMEAIGISYKGFLYVGYYESNGDIVIARRNTSRPDKWEKSILKGYTVTSNDRHNRLSIGISKGDGVIHLAFDHHNTPVFNYAKSAVGVADSPESINWDNSVFELVPNLGISNETGLVTYPSFVQLAETGNMIVYWRSGGAIGGEMNLAHYSSQSHSWGFIGQISSRYGHYKGKYGTRGPYHTGFHSDKNGNLHVAWLWREDLPQRDNENIHYGNHGLFYAQSRDGGYSWLNNSGKQIANSHMGEKLSIDNMDPVVDIPMILEASNARTSSALDPVTGSLHLFLVHNEKTSNTLKPHHYIRNKEGIWTCKTIEIDTGGSKISFFDDYLFAFTGTTIYVSKREDSFQKWTMIPVAEGIPSGPAKWETGNIGNGILSLIVQHNPVKLGQPSPIEVYDFKFADIKH